MALWVKTLAIHVRSSKTPEIDGTQLFVHDDFSRYICPEANGHFCMLWGEHGHGGYDSTSRLYVQGGQPMDDTFELLNLYSDFKEAKAIGDWHAMRVTIQSIREKRVFMEISLADERHYRCQSL